MSGSSPHTRGTRVDHARGAAIVGDHPRIRGEHEAMTGEEARASGIIPAYAGNTTVLINRLLEAEGSSPHTRGTPRCKGPDRRATGDHPRIRGEHHVLKLGAYAVNGIIPAYAGNTGFGAWRSARAAGSSPHTRGTHLFTCDPNSRRGSFVSLYPKRRALCLLLASLQPDFLAP